MAIRTPPSRTRSIARISPRGRPPLLSFRLRLPTRPATIPTLLSRCDVGKVGVPICPRHMRTLFCRNPLSRNTSMTINATPLLLALYIAVADEQGAPRNPVQGTTQNYIVKEDLARGTYVFPPRLPCAHQGRSLFTTRRCLMESDELCSYHLQEAGLDRRAGARLRSSRPRLRASIP